VGAVLIIIVPRGLGVGGGVGGTLKEHMVKGKNIEKGPCMKKP